MVTPNLVITQSFATLIYSKHIWAFVIPTAQSVRLRWIEAKRRKVDRHLQRAHLLGVARPSEEPRQHMFFWYFVGYEN